MSLDLRYAWSSRFVREKLRAGRLSEVASFTYFWVIMVFGWLQFTLIVTTPGSIEAWSVASSWATFAITALGLAYLFHQNGGRKGRHFLRRYFPLSVTVGWKFVLGMMLAVWLVPLAVSSQGAVFTGWARAVVFGVINLAMFWRIGYHLKLLASGGAPLDTQSVAEPGAAADGGACRFSEVHSSAAPAAAELGRWA